MPVYHGRLLSSLSLYNNNNSDIDADTGNDVAYSLGHAYVTHVVHSVRTFQNITSLTLCLQMYVRHAYTGIAY